MISGLHSPSHYSGHRRIETTLQTCQHVGVLACGQRSCAMMTCYRDLMHTVHTPHRRQAVEGLWSR